MLVNCGIASVIYQCAYFIVSFRLDRFGNALRHKRNNSNLFEILRNAIITER